jgi:C4-dicarboxylate transporter DctM subunit
MAVFLLLGMLLLMVIGVPIVFAFGFIGISTLTIMNRVPIIIFVQRIWATMDSFPNLALLFFIISGELMLQGGISRRLINFSLALLGWIRGSLAVITVVTCAFFGAVSGSALATTAAIGSIMYPEMTKDGTDYGGVFTSTLIAVSGTLGTMIPPSIPLILYASVTNCSVSDLFVGIIVPGLIMVVMYLAAAYVYIYKRGLGKSVEKISKGKIGLQKAFMIFLRTTLNALWALLMPVIILGGIYSGAFTPTESAIVACIYALLVGTFVYKELNIKTIYKAFVDACVVTASLMLLIAAANFLGWIMAILNINTAIMAFFKNIVSNKFTFLLIINIIFLIAGMFTDTAVIILLLIPLLAPSASAFDVNLVHLGVIAGINLSMGMITPPFGTSLFVSANITGNRLELMFKETYLYILFGIIGIFIITYIEPIYKIFLK